MTMIRFEQWGPFRKEFERLHKKLRSLQKDVERFQNIVALDPIGQSQHRAVLHQSEEVTIVKARLACESLRKSSLRIIYAYHEETVTIVWIQLYFKGEEQNEDRERIKAYLQSV